MATKPEQVPTEAERDLAAALRDAGPTQSMLLIRKLATLNLLIADRVLRPARWRRNRNPLNGDGPESHENRRNIEWHVPWALIQWLDHHPGARFIISSESVELCARKLEGLPDDDCRFVSFDSQMLERALAEAEDMVEEMLEWEMNGWQYSISDDDARDLLRNLGFGTHEKEGPTDG